MTTLSRRTVLAGLGGALAWPFMKLGRAADVAPPHRLIFVYTDNGSHYDSWRMRFPGMTTDDRRGWSASLKDVDPGAFSRILAPLARWRPNMLALDGLSLLTAYADPYGDAHARGVLASLTGAFGARAFDGQHSFASQPSLDQRVREFLRANDPSLTDLTSLELAITPYPAAVNPLSYATGSDGLPYRVPWERDPAALFDLLYPARSSDPLVGARGRVLDRVRQQYAALGPTLSGSDRARVDLHTDLLADVVRRVDLLSQLSCGDASRPDALDGQSWEGNQGAVMRGRRDAFVDLTVQAMACGLTRVATVSMTPPPMDLLGGVGDFHFEYAHRSGPGADPAVIDVIVRAQQEYAALIDRLLTRLSEVPEGDGSLLDHTTVAWISEMGTGTHDMSPYQVVLFGGASSPFALGRYVHLGRTVPTPAGQGVPGGLLVGPPHNPLLVSLAQAMGLPDDRIGERSVRGVFADGASVEIGLTGRMRELYA